jgi:hypothetical protein
MLCSLYARNMKPMQIMLIVLLAAVIVVVAVRASPEIFSRSSAPDHSVSLTHNQPSLTRRTYINNQYGFSFRYPADLVPSDAQNSYLDDSNRTTFDFPDSDTLSSTTGITSTTGGGDDASSISFGVSSAGTSTCYHIDGQVLLPPNGITNQAPQTPGGRNRGEAAGEIHGEAPDIGPYARRDPLTRGACPPHPGRRDARKTLTVTF